MKRFPNWFAAAGALLATMFGAETALAQKHGGTLKIYFFDSPASMSIHEETTAAGQGPMMAVFNNLVLFKQDVPQSGMDSIIPDLASDCSWDEDKTHLTFRLHEGVKWHDGTPFTAKDVQCTWDLLTGKTSEMLADRANQGNPAPSARSSAAVTAAPALPSGAFPGYPGQRGTVTIRSLASAGSTWLAVGTADGHPAIWRRAADGAWTLVSAATPAVYQRPGVETLTSVAHGSAGWIAVGHVISGVTAPQPVVLTSADGLTWQPLGSLTDFAGPGGTFMGVTASQNGYVVVGRRVDGNRKFAAIWWSADLRNWVSGTNGGLDGSLPSSIAYAVASTPAGFIAVGSHGTCHTVWTSPNGRRWSVYDVPRPAGASIAALREVTVNGTQVVAAGYAVTRAGDVPIAVVSADEGRHWRQILLSSPGGLGSVLALSAAGHGFVAAGRAGPAAAPRAVTWSSPDGRSWSAATAAGGGASQITALTASGSVVSGTAQHAAGPFIVNVPSP